MKNTTTAFAWLYDLPQPGAERRAEFDGLQEILRRTNTAFYGGWFDIVDAWLTVVPTLALSKLLAVGWLRYTVCAVHNGHLPCFPLAVWRVWVALEAQPLPPPTNPNHAPNTPQQILRGLLNPGSTTREDVMAEITTEQRNTAKLANAFAEAWERYHAENGVARLDGIRMMHTAPENALGSKLLVIFPDTPTQRRLAVSTHPPTRRVRIEGEVFDANAKEWATVLSADYFVECFGLAGEWSPELQVVLVDALAMLLGKLTLQGTRAAKLLEYFSPFTAELKTRAGNSPTF